MEFGQLLYGILMRYYKLIIYLSIASVIFPLIIGSMKLKTLSVTLKVLFIYVIICAVTELTSFLTYQGNERKFHVIQNLFTIVEATIFMFLFFRQTESKILKQLAVLSCIFFLLFSSFNIYANGGLTSSNQVITTVEAGLMILFSFLFFFNLGSGTGLIKPTENPFFWINTAILLYFMTSFALFLFHDLLISTKDHTGFIVFHSCQRIINTTCNIFFGIALWKDKRT